MFLEATAKMFSSPHNFAIRAFDCCSTVLMKCAGLTDRSNSPVVEDSPMRRASDRSLPRSAGRAEQLKL